MKSPGSVLRLAKGLLILLFALFSGFAQGQTDDAIFCSFHGTWNAETRQCSCFEGFAGVACQTCAFNYYGFPACRFCLASVTCSGGGACSSNGFCQCSQQYAGANCAACAPDHYGYPTCTQCVAATTCNGNGSCDSAGACQCAEGFGGAGCATSLLACSGFASPFANPISLKPNVNRAIPLKISLTQGGTAIAEGNIPGGALPVVEIDYSPGAGEAGADMTEQLAPVGQSNEGNAFRYDEPTGQWIFNLSTKGFAAAGTYTVRVQAGSPAYEVAATCVGQFIRQGP